MRSEDAKYGLKLFRSLNQGDEQAFDLLYEHYWERLYSFAYKMIQDQELVEDIVQEVFFDLWNRRKQLSDIENPLAFLFQATKFQVYKILRNKNYESNYFRYLESAIDELYSPDEKIYAREKLHLVDRLVANLPEKRKKIFRLRYEDNLSTKEISLLLNISQKTVQNQISTVVNELRSKISDLD